MSDLIETNKPEAVLDRIHIFTVKYPRDLCEKQGTGAPGHGHTLGLLGVRDEAQD